MKYITGRTTVSEDSYGMEVNTGVRSVNSKLATDYSFDVSNGTVLIHNQDFGTCLNIVNQTRGKTIFNPWLPDVTGRQEGEAIYLEASLRGMADEDILLIQYTQDTSANSIDNKLILEGLKELLTEQKITNLHLAKITDENFNSEDI